MSEGNKTGKKKRAASLSSLMRNLDGVSFLKLEWINANIPFLLFAMFLCIVYIWNNHRGVRMVRELRTTEEDMTEVMWNYNSMKDELTRSSRQSKVAERVQDQQMYELTNPPYTIIDK
jgi:hypothetical protein